MDRIIGEGEHAAIGVVENDDGCGAEQLLGNDKGTQGIGGTSACVADDVSIAFLQSQDTRRIETCIHASQDGDLARRWQGQIAFLEVGSVLLIGLQELVNNSHGVTPFLK